MPRSEASDLGLHCLSMSLLWALGIHGSTLFCKVHNDLVVIDKDRALSGAGVRSRWKEQEYHISHPS